MAVMLELLETMPWTPISVEEMKANKRIAHGREDDIIAAQIMAATALLERDYQISVLGRKWKLSLPSFPTEIELPYPPLRYTGEPETAISVKYLDAAGVEQTLATDLATTRRDMTWRLTTLGTWPTTKGHPRAVRIEYTTGYTNEAAVPKTIRQSIMLLASYYYQHRDATFEEPKISMIDRKLAFGIEPLMASYRVVASYGKA